jgi:hypothetical protein
MARTPLRLPRPAAVAIIVACLIAIIYLVSFVVPFRIAGQAYLMIAILLAFRYWPPMIALVRAMPVPHRVVFGALIGAMLLGHFTIRGRTWYPYIAWEIFPFVREEDPVTCHEFIGTTAGGRQVRLLVEQLFPSIVQFNPPFDADGGAVPATDHLVAAMAAMYNARHATDPVRHVDLMVMAVQLHPPLTESRAEPSCELIKQYDISSGP